MLKGNRGEWAEVYVLLKLLADGRLTSAEDESAYIEVLAVLRKELEEIVRYNRDGNQITLIVENEFKKTIPVQVVSVNAKKLLEAINNLSSKKNTIPELNSFLNEMMVNSLSAGGIKDKKYPQFNGKNDIVLETKDSAGIIETQGFSIKSKFKSAATLFNFSSGTRLVYHLPNCTEEQANIINSIITDKGTGGNVKGRMKYIAENLALEFVGSKMIKGERTFQESLQNSGADTINVLNHMLLCRYGYYSCDSDRLSELTKKLAEINPMNVRHPDDYYANRMKSFAYDAFCGLTGSIYWNGDCHVNGGYIQVDDDGNLKYYPAKSDKVFMNFLFNNLKCEEPDKGYKMLEHIKAAQLALNGQVSAGIEERLKTKNPNQNKADFGYVYQEDGQYFIDLNFSLRFC